MDDSIDEIRSLMGEKRRIEATLTAAGGADFHPFLEDCAGLSDLIDAIGEISSKKRQKEHAAFYTKVKFSRKIRRKAKDLNLFEQELAAEYQNQHITFEHGKKMAIILKHLRAARVDEAEALASEFYSFLELGARLEIIDDSLLRKKAQTERALRAVSAQLSDLQWLEGEPPPDPAAVGRHEERVRLNKRLEEWWAEQAQSLKSMPLLDLLAEMGKEGFEGLAFPPLAPADAESLAAFLQKSQLGSKSASQLYEMAGQSEQRLKHSGIDWTGFRQEIVARRAFLSQILSFPASRPPAFGTGSPALAYLSTRSPEALQASARLDELGKTAEKDDSEKERADLIEQKKTQLAEVEKSALLESHEELMQMVEILDGKADPLSPPSPKSGGIFPPIKAQGDPGPASQAGPGILGSVLKFFGQGRRKDGQNGAGAK